MEKRVAEFAFYTTGGTVEERKLRLSLELSQHVVEFREVRIEPVVAWAPLFVRLVRAKSQNGKITRPSLLLAKARKAFSKERSAMLTHHLLAFIYGKNGSQHSLIFRVWLAKVEIGHT
jgi:hypothetical protein